ncbi:Transcriptional activator of fatty acid utilization [Mortierella alpina]|nr:Transcriptional activator of fatty acid utilization [Mortierella alpina]
MMLLNAMFAVASMFSDDPRDKQDASSFFARAKLILDETYYVSTIPSIQALLLMAHHQASHGIFSGVNLHLAIAYQMAHDLGLYRQETVSDDLEQNVIKNRLWWSLYIHDRHVNSAQGRPANFRQDEFSVKEPSDDWVTEIIGEETAGPQQETERVISCRLLWTVKLMKIMGTVVSTMYSIEADTNPQHRMALIRTQVPELHNSLISWFLELPKELAYEPFTSPPSNQPTSLPTAILHMMYYNCLITLHAPYFIGGSSNNMDYDSVVSTSVSICISAANNTGQILDSLTLHGQLVGLSVFMLPCIMRAGLAFISYQAIPTATAQKVALMGIYRFVRISLDLVKYCSTAEVLASTLIELSANQPDLQQQDTVAPPDAELDRNIDPLAILSEPNSAHLKAIYDSSIRAKASMEGFGPTIFSMQLRHPSLDFSTLLAYDGVRLDTAAEFGTTWQTQVKKAIAIAATAFGGSDPREEHGQPSE